MLGLRMVCGSRWGGGLEALGHVRSGVWVVRICVCVCVFIWKTDTVGFKDGMAAGGR